MNSTVRAAINLLKNTGQRMTLGDLCVALGRQRRSTGTLAAMIERDAPNAVIITPVGRTTMYEYNAAGIVTEAPEKRRNRGGRPRADQCRAYMHPDISQFFEGWADPKTGIRPPRLGLDPK